MKKFASLLAVDFRRAAFIVVTLMLAAVGAAAQTVTFGQFIERNGTQDFVFTNGGTSATFQTITNGSPVFFTYQNIANLPADLQGPQLAHVTVTANTTAPATQSAATPPRDAQPFSGTFTVAIIRDTVASSGTGGRRNLLTAVVTPLGISRASLAGDDQSDAAAFTASTGTQSVTFTSDFLGFAPTGDRNLGLSFSSVNPLISIGPGGFLTTFTAAGTGTFASNPVPVFSPPTAAGVSVSGRVFRADGITPSKAIVTLTESDGSTRQVTTNSFGAFIFEDVSAGQLATVSVYVKGRRYESRVIEIADSVADLEFVPAQ